MGWRAWLPLGPICVTLLAGASHHARAEEEVALDEEFLEFLGSLDSDDEAWSALLAAARERDTMKSDAEEKAKSQQVDP